jgi:hypothetical protein
LHFTVAKKNGQSFLSVFPAFTFGGKKPEGLISEINCNQGETQGKIFLHLTKMMVENGEILYQPVWPESFWKKYQNFSKNHTKMNCIKEKIMSNNILKK